MKLGDYSGPKRLKDPVRDETELERLRFRNNSTGRLVGPEHGRCHLCHSCELWVGGDVYYCNCCGNSFPVPANRSDFHLVILTSGGTRMFELVEAM